jgi:hypothetical protein
MNHPCQRLVCDEGFLIMECRCKSGNKTERVLPCSVECKQNNHRTKRGRKIW